MKIKSYYSPMVEDAITMARHLGESAGPARLLATRFDGGTQLVLSSSMKPADLTCVGDSFEIFRPPRLLFAHRRGRAQSAVWKMGRHGKGVCTRICWWT
jgi:hypothetical protein